MILVAKFLYKSTYLFLYWLIISWLHFLLYYWTYETKWPLCIYLTQIYLHSFVEKNKHFFLTSHHDLWSWISAISATYFNIQLILILWQKVRQTRIFAIVRVFPYYEEAKKWIFFRKWRQLWSWKEFYSWIWPKSLRQCLIDV